MSEMEHVGDGALVGRLTGCRVLGLLGKGAFSRVYLVEDDGGEQAACKVCSDVSLLRQEADVHGRVCHSLFPRCLDFRQEAGGGCLLMEYVRGRNLEGFLRDGGRLTEQEGLTIAVQLAEGLRYLHGRRPGILFRDVKPGNVILMADGEVKLLDFGCACPAGDNPGMAGTPGYAAPEQLRFGGSLTPSCDVYGLGSTLRAMVGKFCTRRLKKVLDALTREEPGRRPPDVEWALELLAACRRPEGSGIVAGRRRALTDGQRAILKGEILFRRWQWT